MPYQARIIFIVAPVTFKLHEICKMELFTKIINGWKPLTIFSKGSILEVWQGFELVFRGRGPVVAVLIRIGFS